MKVQCRTVDPAEIGLPSLGVYYTQETVFHVTLGTEYVVMGMGIFKHSLVLLICDETERPNWLPIGLFEVTDTLMPATWQFRLLDGVAASSAQPSVGWIALWGYPELAVDSQHIDKLIERDPDALAVFQRRLGESA